MADEACFFVVRFWVVGLALTVWYIHVEAPQTSIRGPLWDIRNGVMRRFCRILLRAKRVSISRSLAIEVILVRRSHSQYFPICSSLTKQTGPWITQKFPYASWLFKIYRV
jgi:hypothetical protein